MRAFVLMLLFVPTLSGCVAMKSQMWSRAEDDHLYPDTDKPIRGIPIMLKVPSHIEIIVKQKLYATHSAGDKTKEGTINIIPLARPDLEVSAVLKYTEKMFVVDPVRVASGSGSYGFGFSPPAAGGVKNANDQLEHGHGYLNTLDYKAVDTTITTSATLLQSILSLNSPEAATKKSFDAGFDVITIERMVAYHRFDLGSPCVDEEINQFLQEHMNCCHQCSDLGSLAEASSDAVQEESLPLNVAEQ